MFQEKAFRMAENDQQFKNDRPLEVPSLLELCARIVAEHAENLLHFPEKASQQRILQELASEKALLIHHQTCISKTQQSNDQHGLLPVRASEKVLQKLCENWSEMQQITGGEISPEDVDAALAPFYNGHRCPVAKHRHVETLHLLLRVLEMHSRDKRVQKFGTTSLLFIMKNVRMNLDTKRRIIRALIEGMENHLRLPSVMQNCCICLGQFGIPQDILFAYSRLATLITKVLQIHCSNALVQRGAVWLLNSMVCQVEKKQRIEMGEAGAIETILQQISHKLQANTCDDVMVAGWYFLWNITEETSMNCERFLKAQGLTLFSQCYAKFADDNHDFLVENMIGVMVSIAELCKLRDQLITNEYLAIFCKLLDNLNEGGDVYVSYMSAAILANLISDEQVWTKSGVTLSRNHASMRIVQAIEKWELQTRFIAYYTSFKPVLHLLSQWHSIGSQHWAVWTLANLTSTDQKQKYCRMIAEEGSMMELLEQLKIVSRSTDGIQQLADIVIKNVEDWKDNSRDAMMTDSAGEAGNN